MSHRTPAEFIAFTADLLLCTSTSDRERTVAELLNYCVATWDTLPAPLREHTLAVAIAHDKPQSDLPPRVAEVIARAATRGRAVEVADPCPDTDPDTRPPTC